MVHYKLVYWGLRGLGEPIVLLFKYLDILLEEEFVSFEQWPEIKPKTPFGHVPVLYIDGKPLSDSKAIARYVAKEHNLAGKSNFEQERLSSIADFVLEFFWKVHPYSLAKRGFKSYQDFLKQKKTDGLEELTEQLLNERWLPLTQTELPVLVKLLKESGNGYFSKESGLTWVDFYVAEFTQTFQEIDDNKTMSKYPELIAHKERVYALPKVKEYIEQRRY